MTVTTSILQVLSDIGRRLIRSVLLSEVRIRMGACGENDFHTAIKNLTSAKMIEAEDDDLTGDTYYLITPLGEARLKGGK